MNRFCILTMISLTWCAFLFKANANDNSYALAFGYFANNTRSFPAFVITPITKYSNDNDKTPLIYLHMLPSSPLHSINENFSDLNDIISAGTLKSLNSFEQKFIDDLRSLWQYDHIVPLLPLSRNRPNQPMEKQDILQLAYGDKSIFNESMIATITQSVSQFENIMRDNGLEYEISFWSQNLNIMLIRMNEDQLSHMQTLFYIPRRLAPN